MTLDDLQRIKKWHVAHRHTHPVEYHTWDALLTLWVAGWVGWLPAYLFDAEWALPLLMLAMAAPTLYVAWRVKAHRAHKLRCDWSYAAIAPRR
jgi:hypothetical protein